MKAWKHIITGKLQDIQTIPNPLPEKYKPEEWTLTDVTEVEIAALAKVHAYKHTPSGIAGLLTEPLTIFTHNLEEIA